MQSVSARLALLLGLAAAWTLATAGELARMTLKLSTHELPPYSSQQGGRAAGLAVEVVECVARRLDLDLQLEFVPWARAQLHAHSGLSDGFFAASQSDARDAFATLSATIAPQEWRWYTLAQSPLQPGDPAFKTQARVSSFLGANMHSWLKEQGYAVQLPPLHSEALLQMLLLRRVDAILANHLVMARLLERHPQGQEVRSTLALDKPLGVYLTHRFLAQQPADFMARFNAEVKRCVARP